MTHDIYPGSNLSGDLALQALHYYRLSPAPAHAWSTSSLLFSSPFLFLMVFVLVGLAYRWLNEGQRGKEEINVCIAKFPMVKTVASV